MDASKYINEPEISTKQDDDSRIVTLNMSNGSMGKIVVAVDLVGENPNKYMESEDWAGAISIKLCPPENDMAAVFSYSDVPEFLEAVAMFFKEIESAIALAQSDSNLGKGWGKP